MKQVFEIVPPSGSGFGIVAVLLIALLAGLLALFAYMFYGSSHTRVEVSPGQLAIRGGIYGRTIPISELDLAQATVLDLNSDARHALSWRTNGIGMPGYASGWFRTKAGEKTLAFVTERDRVVWIPTRRDFALALSVDRPNEFMSALRSAAQP